MFFISKVGVNYKSWNRSGIDILFECQRTFNLIQPSHLNIRLGVSNTVSTPIPCHMCISS